MGDWAVENDMKINPSKSKRLSFKKEWVKGPLNYSFRGKHKIYIADSYNKRIPAQ